ncbi:Xanthine and CO dehydrogenases maturation factor, XdhC/CoxF family [Indibacter alkaliphilus LW1]|uniref:Xanthine and CO dehydrogenases maturation factor, XdhC/CoxF family n=1 Tax=Indibacter alkaliphilus (strain CCUG 57479 / KCTC 22604 / LW1) TaxID=1189612 RepID=S2DN15_INDAL|nr:XdhC/CoxI family protein [Indibacter alkaliphilus]EOZ98580.1 Xanthine and CO dehydrogenases maturation factor, XdhC/CoxF family [Indibacter alkaliphilus LW1]
MKEITQIIREYEKSKVKGLKTALATVVKVDGSAYRRPGARMLVTEDGTLTGAISGGCLEGDALRKAQSVIFQQKSMVVTYDTTDEDDQKFGVGLGCNGIIQVLIEPIAYEDSLNPIELLKIAVQDRSMAVLITVFSLLNPRAPQIGTKILYKESKSFGEENFPLSSLLNVIRDEIYQSFENQINKVKDSDDYFIFYECIKAPVHLILVGAGNDTIPLTKMASLLGWQLTLADGRKNQATTERFPSANRIVVSPADELVEKLDFDSDTVVVLMTHNFEYEAIVLKYLVKKDVPYIGILGPKKKSEKLFERLINEGIAFNRSHIYGPLGLDIGAEGPEEIALSALAEIKAVLSNKDPQFLKDKKGPIHEG